MKRTRLTITLSKDILDLVDAHIDNSTIRNRSHAIESLLLEKLGNSVRKAVILAAGVGIKFRPFTYELPKAMLPINGRPLLEHIISGLRTSDVRDLYIAVGHLQEKIMSYFGDGSKFGVRITYIEQPKKNIGTAGALKKCEQHISSNEGFFLIYGDVLADINYKDMARFYYKRKGRVGVMALTTTATPEKYGVVRLKGHDVVGFEEKPEAGRTKSHIISAGIFLLYPKIFSYIKKSGKVSLERDVLPKILEKDRMSGYLFEGDWYDIATPKIYEDVLKNWQ